MDALETGSPGAATGIERYRLSPEHTAVRFTTRHLLGLAAVRGSVRLVSGMVHLERAGGQLLSLEAELDMVSFESASTGRDRAVAAPTLLDSAAHPRASFRSVDSEPSGDGWVVRGELTVKGRAAPVELVVDTSGAASGIRGVAVVHASARIDRFDYGITLPTALAARHLRVDIVAHAELIDEDTTAGDHAGS